MSFLLPSFLRRVVPLSTLTLLVASGLNVPSLRSQTSPSSSSSSSSSNGQESTSQGTQRAPGRIAQPEAGGSAITLETSEALFDLAVALNTCGYDTDLAASSPVRQQVRDEINQEVAASAEARTSRDALCSYVRDHTLADGSRNVAQYVSLALYLSPPPTLTPTVDEAELPADATQVVNILTPLRTFADDVHLHAIWVKHHPDYDQLIDQIHDPLTRMILNTNIYLHLPVSSYDGRRFLVLMEPMLAPSETNGRIYATDYAVVVSPTPATTPPVRMDLIRHTYLHYEVEPLVYARAQAMDRLLPLLKPVQDAPLEFSFKSDIVSLLTECLIKAVEIQTMDVGIPKPQPVAGARQRTDLEKYDLEMSAYNHQAEAIRQKNIDLAMRQGWILVDYFYSKLGAMEKESISLKDDIGEMVYGMDVDRERHHATQIQFLPEGTHDLVRRAAPKPTPMQQAEMLMLKGDTAGAGELAQKLLDDPKADHAGAHYVLARVDMMERQPDQAVAEFNQVLQSSKDPRTLAWSHIYMGRLYDVQATPDRQKAVEEYKAALTVRDSQPDTKAAAEAGIKAPFALPKREHPAAQPDDDAPLDPSGKAEKEAYRPEN